MKKEQLIDLLNGYEDDEEIDLNELVRDLEDERERRIEEIEERQHDSGFYSFQDAMYNWRMER